jgi:hypothetical protein
VAAAACRPGWGPASAAADARRAPRRLAAHSEDTQRLSDENVALRSQVAAAHAMADAHVSTWKARPALYAPRTPSLLKLALRLSQGRWRC